ncbi:MAG: hypothetical protein NVS2B12_25750 [Ktedonobacteraceae bacterium]
MDCIELSDQVQVERSAFLPVQRREHPDPNAIKMGESKSQEVREAAPVTYLYTG